MRLVVVRLTVGGVRRLFSVCRSFMSHARYMPAGAPAEFDVPVGAVVMATHRVVLDKSRRR